MRKSTRAAIVYGIAALSLLVIICGGAYISSHKSTAAPGQNTTVTYIAPPASAQEIASQMNCTKFTDKEVSATAHALGVVDLGTCWMDGSKYAINTFKDSADRDAWLKVSEPFGVHPEWESNTSVTY